MNIIDEAIPDSELIRVIEDAKHRDPGFDINLSDENYYCSSLIRAVQYNRKELIEYLLSDPKINVNYKNYYGYTALYLTRDIFILKLLLRHRGIDVNIQNCSGWTGLHWVCCYYNGIEIMRELLLDARVNPSIHNYSCKTARDYAIQKGHHEIANMLKRTGHTSLLRIPNALLYRDISRMIIEEYT